MNTTYLLIIILVICWTINPFFKKLSSKNLNSQEFMFFNHFLCSIIITLYFIYLLYNKQCDIKCVKKLNRYELIYSLIGALLTVISSLVLIKLLKENNASFIIPQIQPLVIFLTIIIGFVIFKEDLDNYKIFGGTLIILGLFIINKKSNES